MSFLGLLIVAALGSVVALASLKPNAFSVSRSAVMNAPANSVFAKLADFRASKSWSPWAKLDPNAKENFEGPESGVGSSFAWSGNRKVGAGKMTMASGIGSATNCWASSSISSGRCGERAPPPSS